MNRYYIRSEEEISENLRAAGCKDKEITKILECIQKKEKRNAEKLIELCRKKQLDRMHDSQSCIERLDYLSYLLQCDERYGG